MEIYLQFVMWNSGMILRRFLPNKAGKINEGITVILIKLTFKINLLFNDRIASLECFCYLIVKGFLV